MNKGRFAFTLVSVISVAVISLALMVPSPAFASGAKQISGISYYPGPGECTDLASLGASYVVVMTGDLQGCHYTFVETAVCSPGGTYIETGNELFISSLNPNDTFRTTYRFEAKFKDCAHAAGEIVGRCQHPIVEGSGRGIFEGVKGQLNFRDDVVAVIFPYRGHLQY